MVEDLAELIGPYACCQAVNTPAPFFRFDFRLGGGAAPFPEIGRPLPATSNCPATKTEAVADAITSTPTVRRFGKIRLEAFKVNRKGCGTEASRRSHTCLSGPSYLSSRLGSKSESYPRLRDSSQPFRDTLHTTCRPGRVPPVPGKSVQALYAYDEDRLIDACARARRAP